MNEPNHFRPAKSRTALLAAPLIGIAFLGPAIAEVSPVGKPAASAVSSIPAKGPGSGYLSDLLPFLVTSSDRRRLAAELLASMEQGDLQGAENSLNAAIEAGTFAIALIDHLRDPNLLTALQGLGIQGAKPLNAADGAAAPATCSMPAPSVANIAEMQEALDREQSYSGMLARTLTDLMQQYNALTARLEANPSENTPDGARMQQVLQREQQCEAAAEELARVQEDRRELQGARERDSASSRSNIATLEASLQRERERGDTAERQLAGAQEDVSSLRVFKDRETASGARIAELEKVLSEQRARGDELARMLADATEALHAAQDAQARNPPPPPEPAPVEPDPERVTSALPAKDTALVEIAQAPDELRPLPAGTVAVAAPAAAKTPPDSAATAGEARTTPPPQDVTAKDRLTTRADELLRTGDVSGARLLLERALEGGNARAAFLLAETFDPQVLSRLGVRGIRGDPEKARDLYAKAQALGVVQAAERMEALK